MLVLHVESQTAAAHTHPGQHQKGLLRDGAQPARHLALPVIFLSDRAWNAACYNESWMLSTNKSNRKLVEIEPALRDGAVRYHFRVLAHDLNQTVCDSAARNVR